jgi:exportin-1
LFFCAYLKQHGSLIEKREMHEGLLKSLHYLLLISEVDEVEIFKICLEYWNSLAADLYHECPFTQTHSTSLFMSRPTGTNAGGKKRLLLKVLTVFGVTGVTNLLRDYLTREH